MTREGLMLRWACDDVRGWAALGVGQEKGRKCVAAKAVQAVAAAVALLEASNRRAAANRLAQVQPFPECVCGSWGLLALWLNGWMDSGEGKQIVEALAGVKAEAPLMDVLVARLS
eukprot:1114652-Rhodomonas_salina.2